MHEEHLGNLLIEMGHLNKEQLDVALAVQKVRETKLEETLLSLSFVSAREISEAIAMQCKREHINILEIKPQKDLLKMFDINLLKDLCCLPFDIANNSILVAAFDPVDIRVSDMIRRVTGKRAELFVADKESILKSIEIAFYLLEKSVESEIKYFALSKQSDTPALLEMILKFAVTENATDIHFSPEAFCSHIFFRTDGIMNHRFAIPLKVHTALISRIKILSELDIAEQRLPQDGSLSANFFSEEYDIRVSTIPTPYGENAVLRILSKNLSLFSLESLGFDSFTKERLEKCFSKPHGIFLVTGPTGSGKTTTLYSALRRINALKKRILTVENPIEYRFPFIKQTQVNEKSGYNFPEAMRAFLRQDPDVILLGEMRDEETAEMSMRAAITGHLVLSTMHTNDAVTAIPRLLDLKVKNYLIASGVSGVMAQRLVRKICKHCARQRKLTDIDIQMCGVEFFEKLLTQTNATILEPTGCAFCGYSGYQGRTVVSEFLETDSEIQDMIIKGATPNEIQLNAASKGMLSMFEDGIKKAFNGITTIEEVVRVASK